MTHLADLPLWAAIPICILILAGAIVTFIGALGLLRLPTFYDRLHAPSLGASAGTILICLASMATFAILQNRWVFHEVLIIIFVTLTTPVTLMLLGQSALYRDRIEEREGIPRKKMRKPEPETPDAEMPEI